MIRYRLGTMGFSEKDWQGTFYPDRLASSRWLSYYASRFDCTEMNTTFHATPSRDVIEKWCRSVPETFRFAVKVAKHITHDGTLIDAIRPMQDFAAAMRDFGPRLGPLLVQLPPWCGVEQAPGLKTFVNSLPGDLRFAIEFRSPGWQCDEVYRLLTDRNIALVGLAYDDNPEQAQLHATADFHYVRLIGKHERYEKKDREQRDPTSELETWHARILAAPPTSGECWVTVNNEFAGHSPATLRRFAAIAGVALPKEIRQGSLFD